MSYTVESEKLQKFVVIVKYLQFIFLSILFYGTAMLTYDLVQLIPGIEISAWSIGCTVFGGEGAIMSYFITRSTEKKIEKLIKEGKKLNER
ncbi:hypothetical protein LCGC14_2943770 [marine sediment metagenome]|uniref:Uncharacterized protein n=1 Tax=marine sediment metagenome TaxID=412755 RepID=A0A0F8Y4D4_9ZZZZ|nr:hypothetical protein [archaeon]